MQSRRGSRSGSQLRHGSRVAVVGGGPAGSFFSYFLLQAAERVGLEVAVDLFEPRDFSCRGPKGCNMCGGIVSESLIQRMAAEGLALPAAVIQRRIDSYCLHMDVGSVRIATPLQEMRIAAVARGSGPRTGPEGVAGLDAFLLGLATDRGARRLQERVTCVRMEDGRPLIETADGTRSGYDLFVGAMGVNSPLSRNLELGRLRAPRSTKAYIAEFHLGRETIDRHLGSTMHVFLLNMPRLDFAALIPKGEYATFCLLGERIDKPLVRAVLDSEEVREVLPPYWELPRDFCHCAPLLNVGASVQPYGERVVLIGDSGATRLFKDGIGAAYRTAKAAARTAVLRGVGASDFRRGYAPTCRAIQTDNRLGRAVFKLTRLVQRTRGARRALWRTTSGEQRLRGSKRRMSRILWNTFTGSAPYRSVLLEGLHPAVWTRLSWDYACGLRFGETIPPRGRVALASGRTGLDGLMVREGAVIFREGEAGTCMYLVGSGSVELARTGSERPGVVATLGPGDFFGEMALLGEQTRGVTARAREETLLYALERRRLLLRIHEDPAMAMRLIEAVARRADRAEEGLLQRRVAEEWPADGAADEPEQAASKIPAVLAAKTGLLGKPHDAGDVIYRQSDRGDSMFVVQGGRVELVRRCGAVECRVAVLNQGDFFGEMALFQSEIRSATARALERVHVLTLERGSLLQCIVEDPSVALSLVENIARRIDRMEHAARGGSGEAAPAR